MSLKAVVETIGPNEAEALLATQEKNRSLSVNRTSSFLHQMRDGEWQLNGQPIVIDESGKLLDGQHRLQAVKALGKPIRFLVVRGVDRDSFRTMDTGKSRSSSDLLFMANGVGRKGIANVSAAALRWLWKWESGDVYSKGTKVGDVPAEPTRYEVLDLYKKHPGIVEAVEFIEGKRMQLPGLLPGPSAFCFYVINMVDVSDARTFFGKLISGANLSETDPIFRLRNRIIQRKARGVVAGNLGAVEYVAITFKAWNAWRAKQPIHVLSWRPSEPIPVPV